MKRLVLTALLMASLSLAAVADSSPIVPKKSASLPPPSAGDVHSSPNGVGNSEFKASSRPATQESTTLAMIPEPGTLCLLGTGLLGLASLMRRRNKSKQTPS